MALGLINVTGTSGSVLIKYKIGIVEHSLIADIGDTGIDTTAIDVTYTTIAGNAIAASLSFTITALSYVYYNFTWKEIMANNYKVTNVLLGTTVYTISEVSFPNTNTDLITNINSLNNNSLKITDFKNSNFSVLGNITLNNTPNNSYIMKVIGDDVPELKIKNSDNSGFIYIKGLPILYPVIGYTSVPVCNPILI